MEQHRRAPSLLFYFPAATERGGERERERERERVKRNRQHAFTDSSSPPLAAPRAHALSPSTPLSSLLFSSLLFFFVVRRLRPLAQSLLSIESRVIIITTTTTITTTASPRLVCSLLHFFSLSAYFLARNAVARERDKGTRANTHARTHAFTHPSHKRKDKSQQ